MDFRIIRNTQVITDSDLALYLGLMPKSLISFFKRNIQVFPQDTFFQLNEEEKKDLVKNYCLTHAERLRYAKRLPYVFTPSGAVLAVFLLKRCKKAAVIRQKMLALITKKHLQDILSE